MIKTTSSCGPDGIHPSWITSFDRQHTPHLYQIRQILDSALDRPDFFSARPVLIPKKDGNCRPIMVLNNPLRYLEKGLLATLKDMKFTNTNDLYGFITGRSTHDAYDELKTILKDNQKTKVTFLDFSKAYNSVDRRLLLRIMRSKLDYDTYACVENLVNKQNVKIYNRYLVSDYGVPQGSAISPILFNHYVDCMITVLKKKMPRLQRIIAYADDLVLIGEIDYKMLIKITKNFSLSLNPKKSATFNWRTRNLPMRKTYCYLGTKIKSNGMSIGECNIVKKMQNVAKQTKRFSIKYPVKALRLLLAIGGGVHKFYDKRFENMNQLPTLIKTTLRLPCGLDRPTATLAAKAIMDKPENLKSQYADSILALLRHDGVKINSDRRIRIKWKTEYFDQESVDRELSRVKLLCTPTETVQAKPPKRSTKKKVTINNTKSTTIKPTNFPPKKPPNMFFIFHKEQFQIIKKENPNMKTKEITKKTSKLCNSLDDKEKSNTNIYTKKQIM